MKAVLFVLLPTIRPIRLPADDSTNRPYPLTIHQQVIQLTNHNRVIRLTSPEKMENGAGVDREGQQIAAAVAELRANLLRNSQFPLRIGIAPQDMRRRPDILHRHLLL